MTLADVQALERDYVMPTYARLPVEFVRGEGTRLWDAEGNEYLDFLAGISVSQIGHCHAALVEAVSEQAGRLIHVSNLYYSEPGMRLAQRLSERSLGGKVFFCNSGAEATECALKLARKRRPGGGFVVLEGKDALKGGKGNDKLFGGAGDDSLSGEAGRDALDGGAGNDKLNGGPDKNTYKGGSGKDSINARNGKKETVDCGSGKKDSATVDRNDKVKGCEKVKRRK